MVIYYNFSDENNPISYLFGEVKAKSIKRSCRVSYRIILPSEIPVKGPLPNRSKAMEKGPTEVDGKSNFLKMNIGWERTK